MFRTAKILRLEYGKLKQLAAASKEVAGKRGNEAFDVHANTYRFDADVVLCFRAPTLPKARAATKRKREIPVDYQFQSNCKFGILNFNKSLHRLLGSRFPASRWNLGHARRAGADLGIWKAWIGSIRSAWPRPTWLLFASTSPRVHQRLGQDLSRLFNFVHLGSGIECESADMLLGSSRSSTPEIRQISQFATFY